MRFEKVDAKAGTFFATPQTLEDLWALRAFLRAGDLVRARTFRRAEERPELGRSVERERVPVTLTVQLERAEFDEQGARLRLHGTIVEAEEGQGSHHTILSPTDERLEIARPGGLSRLDQARIRQMHERGRTPILVVVAMDRDEATIASILPWGVRELATVRAQGMGKQYETKDTTHAYYADINLVLLTLEFPILIVGPGLERENYLAYLRQHQPALASRCRTEPGHHTGLPGVHEAIRRGAVARVAKGVKQADDLEAVSKFEEALAQGLGTYGPEHVRAAVEQGNAVEVIVVDTHAERLRDVLERAEGVHASVRIVAPEGPAGEAVEALGGVVARTRWVGPA